MDGWISIHRKIKENSWYSDSQYVHLWLHLLLSANYKDSDLKIDNKIIHLKRGQLLTSRKSLSSAVQINESKIYRILKCFENEHQIEQQKTSKYTVITILKYDIYQKSEQQICCSMNNQRTANEQPVNTNNKDNNIYINLLINKYKENFPQNYWQQFKRISEIKKTNEYQKLTTDEQQDLYIKLIKMKKRR